MPSGSINPDLDSNLNPNLNPSLDSTADSSVSLDPYRSPYPNPNLSLTPTSIQYNALLGLGVVMLIYARYDITIKRLCNILILIDPNKGKREVSLYGIIAT